MVNKTLHSYVEQVYTLEWQQYTLTQIIESINQKISALERQLRQEKLMEDGDCQLIVNTNYEGDETTLANIGIMLIIGSVIFSLFGLSICGDYDTTFIVAGFIIVCIIFIVGIFMIKVGNFLRNWRISELNKKKADAYERAQTSLNEVIKQNDEIRKKCENLKSILNQLEKNLSEKKNALHFMYEYNIIHKNYRNFYGISKIYQLIDTEICDSLTGVDGAYSQMRTDQIIDNQKISINLLGQLIATNQMMKQAIDRTNMILMSENKSDYTMFLDQSENDNKKAFQSNPEYIEYIEKSE